MRSHYCGTLKRASIGQQVRLCGWVNRRRDHGGVIFVDLRDRSRLVQLVFNPYAQDMFTQAEKLRNEFVLRVTGTVGERPQGTINAELPTGEIEVRVTALEILNESPTPPFQLDEVEVNEESRLKYRYIDLRRPHMQE